MTPEKPSDSEKSPERVSNEKPESAPANPPSASDELDVDDLGKISGGAYNLKNPKSPFED